MRIMSSIAGPIANPRRVAAGKVNGPKRGPLSEASIQRLRAAALRNKPWLHSSGPKTPEWRRQAALNGKCRQLGPRSVREMQADLRAARLLVWDIRVLHRQFS
jgi:hypothetical protein